MLSCAECWLFRGRKEIVCASYLGDVCTIGQDGRMIDAFKKGAGAGPVFLQRLRTENAVKEQI